MQAPLAQLVGAYREYEPPATLREHVRCFWVHDLKACVPAKFLVLPDGCVDIVWGGREVCVLGPDTLPVIAAPPAGVTLIGVRFHPGAAPGWLRVSAAELVNSQPVGLRAFWGLDADRLADQLLQAADPGGAVKVLGSSLSSRLSRVAPPDSAIRRVVCEVARAHSEGRPVVRRLLGLGWNERTLHRRCISAFGYGPKTLDRILRFQRVVDLLKAGPHQSLASIATEAGFADQAHLAREAQRWGGTTPSDLQRQIQRHPG